MRHRRPPQRESVIGVKSPAMARANGENTVLYFEDRHYVMHRERRPAASAATHAGAAAVAPATNGEYITV